MLKGMVLAFVLSLMLCNAATAKELTFAYESYPPYEFSEGGELKGIDVDMIKAVCAKLGVTPKFQEMPWKRAVSEVKEGKVDGIFSLYLNEERKGFLYFPDQGLSYEKNILASRKDGGVAIGKLEDLAGKTVGVVSEYSYGDPFDSYKDMRRDESPNVELLLKKLDNKRTAVVIINELVFNSLTRKLALADTLAVQPYVPSNEAMYVAFSQAKGDAGKDMAAAFSKVLEQLKASGEKQKIIDSYQ